MAAGRTLRSLLSRRRRGENEEEEETEEGPVVVEDSQSEGSVLSEIDDEDGDGSSVGNRGEAATARSKGDDESPIEAKAKKPRKSRKSRSKKDKETVAESSQSQPNFKAMADTKAMMNGLGISEDTQAPEAVDFEAVEESNTAQGSNPPVTTNGHVGTPAERQRREHEEYRRKRDADPAFIPNRGNFFMHDTRGQRNGQPPQPRGVWQGRRGGRGGAGVGGPFSPANQMALAERAAEGTWKHDLHDTINEDSTTQLQAPRLSNQMSEQQGGSTHLLPKAVAPPNEDQPRVLSFSRTTLVGKVQIRVFLLGMKTPTSFSEVPWKHYTRLPDHRPPLRRDKPVRVCLPGHPQRYIFPSTDRSFIFIPRQNRPNHQGYHRGQYQRSVGGYGYSSRRTSMYGGSMYSGSVAPSRRSSFVGVSRENAFSPAGSFVGPPSNRPIVRLPHGGGPPFSAVSTPIGPLSGHQTPTGMPQIHTYPPPQQPAHFGTPTTTVHQPRPQKAISVTGIESPMLQQEPQPFQNQLPAHISEPPPPPPYFSPRASYQQPQHLGSPLTSIREQAVHAPAFQPPAYNQPQFYPPYPPPPNFYYPPPPVANGYPQMPMYMLPNQGYMGPPPPAPPPPHHPQSIPPQQSQQPPPPPSEEQHSQQTQSGMVGQERNGMVYYVPASEAQQSEHYQPAESFVPSYAMPGLPPPTPAPESEMVFHYYHHQQQHHQPQMQEVGSGVYYPARPVAQ